MIMMVMMTMVIMTGRLRFDFGEVALLVRVEMSEWDDDHDHNGTKAKNAIDTIDANDANDANDAMEK